MRSAGEDTIQFPVRVDHDTHAALRRLAFDLGVSMAEIVRGGIDRVLADAGAVDSESRADIQAAHRRKIARRYRIRVADRPRPAPEPAAEITEDVVVPTVPDCSHPVNRRIGPTCAECGKDVVR